MTYDCLMIDDEKLLADSTVERSEERRVGKEC